MSTISTKGPGFFAELWEQAKLGFRLFLDPKVPIYVKLVPIAAAAYLLFPVDFLPDMVPGLGQLDDLTILLLGTKLFIELAPKDIVAKYLATMRAPGEGGGSEDWQAKGAKDTQGGADIIDGIIIEDDESGFA